MEILMDEDLVGKIYTPVQNPAAHLLIITTIAQMGK